MSRKREKNMLVQSGVTLVSFAPSGAVAQSVAYPGSATSAFGNSSSVLQTISDGFLFYRFTRLGIELIDGSYVAGGSGVLGWYPEASPAANPSLTQSHEAPWSLPIPSASTSNKAVEPIAKVHWIPPKLIRPVMVKWLRTRTGGSDDNFEVQGTLIWVWSANIDTTTIRLHYTIEYKDVAPTAVTVPRQVMSDLTQDALNEEMRMMRAFRAFKRGDDEKSDGSAVVIRKG